MIGGYLGWSRSRTRCCATTRRRTGPAVLVTLGIALAFDPLRVRLQRRVDRALYGDRSDPVRAVSRLGNQVAVGDEADMLAAVLDALRLPYAALRVDGADRAVAGTLPARTETCPLLYRGARVGELVIGVRPGQRRLSAADRAGRRPVDGPDGRSRRTPPR